MKPPAWSELVRWLGRPRTRVLLGLLLLAVAARVALPYGLRPLIVSQADAALEGRIALADLDLSLIRGGVTLHGLELRVDELPPEGAPAAVTGEALPPVFEAKQLWTQISWLALLRKTIEIEEFELDGFAVRLDRLTDGLRLPKPAPGDAPAEPEPETQEPSGWSFAADSVAFRDGQIRFRDFTVGSEPQQFDLAVKDVSADNLALVIDAAGLEPGHVVVSAQIGEGQLGLDARIEARGGGFEGRSKIALANLPVDGVRAYLSTFGWSDLSGSLDASIEHHFVTGGAHELAGVVSLSEVSVRVADLAQPALAWKRLGVDVEQLDLVKQHAAVSSVTLEGARVAIDPRAAQPVRLLPPPSASPAAAPPAAPEPAAEVSAESPRPWSWRVAKTAISDSTLDLLGAEAPLPIGVALEVRDVASEAGTRWPLSLSLTPGAGTLVLDGALGVEPLAFEGKLAIDALALPPLLARLDVPAAGWLRRGSLRSDLALALAPRAGAAGSPPPTDLRVSGTLGLADLDVNEARSAKDFSVAWKDLEIGVRELAIPALLGGADAARPLAIGVNLDRVRLAQPALRITRDAQGIVLPELAATAPASGETAASPAPADPETASSPAPAAASPAAANAPAGPQVKVEIAQAQIEGGRAQIVDRSVKPFYNSKIDAFALKARGIRWPGPYAKDVALDARGLQGATLTIRGSVAPGDSKLEMKLVKLPLAPFNPYVTASGYSLAGGTLSIDSQAKLANDAYDTSSSVLVSQLDVGGAEGDSLFQQNFGIPLSVALGLLKDLDGNIDLAVPVAGDRQGAKLGLRGLMTQALRKALIGALASPLKLFGAITADGKVQGLAPEPIAFVAGTAELAPEGRARIEQLAGLLSASPGIALTLRGATAPADLRWLEEQALLAELRASSGVRALANLGEIGMRRAVRQYLEARSRGEEAALEPEQREWLDAHAAAQDVPAARLAALADARAAAAQRALADEYGIRVERLTLGPPVGEPPAPAPGVAISLGAVARAAP